LRDEPLIERKRLLKSLIPPQPSPLVYVDHFEGEGRLLYEHCCRLDLEGIVAKHRDSAYEMNGAFRVGRERTSWAKIRNPNYTQWEGRRELFEKRSA
jgi:ATP-dependent DNA ligase